MSKAFVRAKTGLLQAELLDGPPDFDEETQAKILRPVSMYHARKHVEALPEGGGKERLRDLAKRRITAQSWRASGLMIHEAKLIMALLKQDGACLLSLDISDNNLGDEAVTHVASLLQHPNCSLLTLDLSRVAMTQDGAEALALSLHSNTSLTELRCSGNRLRGAGASCLGRMLGHNETLLELRLDKCKVDGAGGAGLAEGLTTNSTLRLLDVSHNSIGITGARAFGDALAGQAGLTSLSLRDNLLGSKSAEALSEGLAKHLTMEVFDAGRNAFGEATTMGFAIVLEVQPTLRELDLRATKIGPSVADRMSVVLLNYNTTLQQLHLEGNPLGPLGVCHLRTIQLATWGVNRSVEVHWDLGAALDADLEGLVGRAPLPLVNLYKALARTHGAVTAKPVIDNVFQWSMHKSRDPVSGTMRHFLGRPFVSGHRLVSYDSWGVAVQRHPPSLKATLHTNVGDDRLGPRRFLQAWAFVALHLGDMALDALVTLHFFRADAMWPFAIGSAVVLCTTWFSAAMLFYEFRYPAACLQLCGLGIVYEAVIATCARRQTGITIDLTITRPPVMGMEAVVRLKEHQSLMEAPSMALLQLYVLLELLLMDRTDDGYNVNTTDTEALLLSGALPLLLFVSIASSALSMFVALPLSDAAAVAAHALGRPSDRRIVRMPLCCSRGNLPAPGETSQVPARHVHAGKRTSVDRTRAKPAEYDEVVLAETDAYDAGSGNSEATDSLRHRISLSSSDSNVAEADERDGEGTGGVTESEGDPGVHAGTSGRGAGAGAPPISPSSYLSQSSTVGAPQHSGQPDERVQRATPCPACRCRCLRRCRPVHCDFPFIALCRTIEVFTRVACLVLLAVALPSWMPLFVSLSVLMQVWWWMGAMGDSNGMCSSPPPAASHGAPLYAVCYSFCFLCLVPFYAWYAPVVRVLKWGVPRDLIHWVPAVVMSTLAFPGVPGITMPLWMMPLHGPWTAPASVYGLSRLVEHSIFVVCVLLFAPKDFALVHFNVIVAVAGGALLAALLFPLHVAVVQALPQRTYVREAATSDEVGKLGVVGMKATATALMAVGRFKRGSVAMGAGPLTAGATRPSSPDRHRLGASPVGGKTPPLRASRGVITGGGAVTASPGDAAELPRSSEPGAIAAGATWSTTESLVGRVREFEGVTMDARVRHMTMDVDDSALVGIGASRHYLADEHRRDTVVELERAAFRGGFLSGSGPAGAARTLLPSQVVGEVSTLQPHAEELVVISLHPPSKARVVAGGAVVSPGPGPRSAPKGPPPASAVFSSRPLSLVANRHHEGDQAAPALYKPPRAEPHAAALPAREPEPEGKHPRGH